MSSDWLSDSQKIGLGLTAFGLVFGALGILFFFDSALISMGNILFLLGILFVIGPKSVMKCVLRGGNRRLKGTIALLGGVVIVFFRYSVIGVILEAYGAFVLFGDFAPQAIRFLRRIPIAGQVLSLPFISMIVDKIAGPRQPV